MVLSAIGLERFVACFEYDHSQDIVTTRSRHLYEANSILEVPARQLQ